MLDSITVKITGKRSSYDIKSSLISIDSKTLLHDLSGTDFIGFNSEDIRYDFEIDKSKSVAGNILENRTVECVPWSERKHNPTLDIAGISLHSLLWASIVLSLGTYLLFSTSPTMLWTLLNCLQVQFYLPYFSLYFPFSF